MHRRRGLLGASHLPFILSLWSRRSPSRALPRLASEVSAKQSAHQLSLACRPRDRRRATGVPEHPVNPVGLWVSGADPGSPSVSFKKLENPCPRQGPGGKLKAVTCPEHLGQARLRRKAGHAQEAEQPAPLHFTPTPQAHTYANTPQAHTYTQTRCRLTYTHTQAQ